MFRVITKRRWPVIDSQNIPPQSRDEVCAKPEGVACLQVEANFLLEPSEEKRGLGAASGAAGVSEVSA